jgi:hypothetical protein
VQCLSHSPVETEAEISRERNCPGRVQFGACARQTPEAPSRVDCEHSFGKAQEGQMLPTGRVSAGVLGALKRQNRVFVSAMRLFLLLAGSGLVRLTGGR